MLSIQLKRRTSNSNNYFMNQSYRQEIFGYSAHEENKKRTFSSWFISETRMELVVFVRSFWGILNPRSIAYNRPAQKIKQLLTKFSIIKQILTKFKMIKVPIKQLLI